MHTIKSFLDDITDAPDDIRGLQKEMDILAQQAGKISTLVTNSNQSPQRVDGCVPALAQCVSAVTTLRQKIEKDAKRLEGHSAGKWWDQMRAATGNKGLAKHIAKVERAKTQLIIAMQ